MSAEIVNLRKVRKAKAKADKAHAADENRARFGRTKAERVRDEDVRQRLARELDGARRKEGRKEMSIEACQETKDGKENA